jgi:hypothetical protein
MPIVRVLLREGQEKLYYDAQASMHTPDRTLRITRNQDSIAEFQSEYGSYIDNRPSAPYGPWQTVAYAEGER